MPSRRKVLAGLFGVGALASFGISGSALRAQLSILLPPGPMRLSRRIERSLRGNASLSVTRSWRVNFSQQGQGIAISGQQLSAEVDAPEELAPLAAIERERSTAEMWPILLTSSGMIMAAGAGTNAQDLARATQVARRMIEDRPAPASLRAAQDQYLADLHQAGSSLLDRLPDDLFYPSMGPISSVQSVELPQGMTGQFELSYVASAVPGKGWLDRAERHVTTRLAGTERTAREVWTLSPM